MAGRRVSVRWTTNLTAVAVVTAVCISVLVEPCQAFSIWSQQQPLPASVMTMSPLQLVLTSSRAIMRTSRLWVSDDGNDDNAEDSKTVLDETNESADAMNEVVEDDISTNKDNNDTIEEDNSPKEDSTLSSLKDEISSVEAQVRTTRRKAADVSDRADDYSKAGYARKVAELENMRRARSVGSFVLG